MKHDTPYVSPLPPGEGNGRTCVVLEEPEEATVPLLDQVTTPELSERDRKHEMLELALRS